MILLFNNNTYIYKENITYYFAYSIPYSYSDLQHKLLALKTDYLSYISQTNINKNKIHVEENDNDEECRNEKKNYIKNILNNPNLNNKKSLMINPKYFWDNLLESDPDIDKDPHRSKFSYNDIYFNHRVLTRSYNKLNLDLITISSLKNMMVDNYENPNIKDLFPLQNEEKIKMFNYDTSSPQTDLENLINNKKNKKRKSHSTKKKIVFISARVHPGEVVSSYILDGIIEYLLRDNDIRSKYLRDKYVFKIVPMLNPDGVK